MDWLREVYEYGKGEIWTIVRTESMIWIWRQVAQGKGLHAAFPTENVDTEQQFWTKPNVKDKTYIKR
jgi:hypothetical protein